MKKSLIQQFLDGASAETVYRFPHSSEFHKAAEEAEQIREKLIAPMDKATYALLDAYECKRDHMYSVQSDTLFIRGFCHGARLILEVLNTDTFFFQEP